MRLFFLAQQLDAITSGLGTYARALVEGLLEEGHEITLAVPRGGAEPRPGLTVRPLDAGPATVTPLSRPGLARAFRRALADGGKGHDLVHFLDAREAGLAARRRPGEPVRVGTVHDTYALDWCAPGYPRRIHEDRLLRGIYYAWLRRFERRAYRRLDLLLANSAHVRDRVLRGYGPAPERVRVVRLGLPEAPPAAAVPLEGDPAVLFVGANYQRKGLPVLLSAVARASRERPGIRLHVVGGDPREALFRRRAAESGLGERAIFHGRVPNERVRAFMAGADLLAVPSLVEALGLAYFEALQAGIPVIATRAGGTPEYLEDGVSAILVPPGDVEALARALLELGGKEELRNRLVRGGRAAARALSVPAMVSATLEAYREALGGR